MTEPAFEPVRAGFIGVGNFVSANHLPNAAASPAWSVEAVCDIDPQARARAEEHYRPRRVTADYREILADPAIEVVFIGTRHDMHEPLIRETAAAGKDTFVEKPMSKTWPETRAILESVQSAGTRLMVGYNRRFSPAMRRAREVFHSQGDGQPALWTYRAVDDARFWPDWPMDPAIGGGKVMSEGCHFYDLACWFLEREPVRVQCAGRRDDDNMIQIVFDDGSVATVVSGGCGSAAYPKERMEVFRGGRTLVLDMFLELHTAGYEGVGDETFPLQQDPYPDVDDAGSIAGFRRRAERWSREGIRPEELERKAYGGYPKVDKGHRQEIDAFAAAIRAGRPSPCGVVDGARATAIALRAIESLEDGGSPKAIRPEDYQ